MLMHSGNRFARFVSWVSFVGLVIGVMVLTVVVTVMNGFDRELKQRLLSSIPHVTVASSGHDVTIAELNDGLKGYPAKTNIHKYYRGFGAASSNGQVYPLGIYAIDEKGVDSLKGILASPRRGSLHELFSNPRGLVLGEPVARMLGLQIGDSVVLMVVQAENMSVRPQLLRFELVATFELGAQTDYSLAVVNLHRLPRSVWQASGENGWQIQLSEPMHAADVAAKITAKFANNPTITVDSWASSYGELFRAVQLEKSMMFLLLLLVVAVASFNIIAGQTMVVNDKRGDIGILRTMGANQQMIRLTFLVQGLCICVSGTIIGLILGLLSANNINVILDGLQVLTGMHLLDGSFFVTVPVDVQTSDLVIISSLSVGLGLISAWLPANRASRLNPVSVLH